MEPDRLGAFPQGPWPPWGQRPGWAHGKPLAPAPLCGLWTLIFSELLSLLSGGSTLLWEEVGSSSTFPAGGSVFSRPEMSPHRSGSGRETQPGPSSPPPAPKHIYVQWVSACSSTPMPTAYTQPGEQGKAHTPTCPCPQPLLLPSPLTAVTTQLYASSRFTCTPVGVHSCTQACTSTCT